MMSPFKTVWLKEIKENLRDKRTLLSSVVMGSLMGPIMMLGLMNLIVKMQSDKAEEQLELPVINMQLAKSFEKYLKSNDIKILDLSKAPVDAIRDKDHDVVIEIDESYAKSFSDGKPAKVKLYYDNSAKGAAKVSVSRVKALVNGYSSSIGSMRLQLRGVSPSLTQAVMIEDHDISTTESRGGMFLSFLPYFMIIGLFIGSMYLAIDSTAGEKERKSMEPLFLNPVTRSSILSGKLAATVSFALLTLLLTMIAFKLTVPFYPFDKMGISFSLTFNKLLVMLVVLLPLALLAASLQTIIAAFSKGFREAQTYVGLVMVIPMIPSMLLMFLPIKEKLWMMVIPILGQNLVINQIMKGENVEPLAIILTVLGTLIVGMILAWAAVRLYNRESMLFSD